jgi:5,10-methylene-tetrahydrofolate dehydrogenase/methenyl tetrahydrofolate cyclohydrolase
VADLTKKLPNFKPGLAIVQVGGREDSNVYIRMKLKAATEIGIAAEHIQLPKSITEGELLAKVRNFCRLMLNKLFFLNFLIRFLNFFHHF